MWTELFACKYCDICIWLSEKPESLTLKTGNDYACTKGADGSYSVQHFPTDCAIYCAGDTTYTIEKIQVKPCSNCKQQTIVTVEGVTEPDAPIVYNGQPVDNNVFGTPVFKNGTEEITGIEAEYTYYRIIWQGNYEKLVSNPTDAGIYKVDIAVPDSDNSYMGNIEIDFTIQRADKIELQEGEGYQINYENRTIAVYDGYEVSAEAVGEGKLCVAVESITPGVTYYIRSTSRNYNKHPWKNIEVPSQPAEPSGVQGVAPSTATEINGRITGVTTAMEYTADGGQSWISIPEGTGVISVVPGNYGVRMKATSTSFSGETKNIKVNTFEEEHPVKEEENEQEETDQDSEEADRKDTDQDSEDSGENAQYADNDEIVTEAEKLENSLALDTAFKVYINGKDIHVRWGKVTGATGYDVYIAYSDKKFSKIPAKAVSSGGKTSVVIKELNGKAINQKKVMKCYVIAYHTVNGKKVTLGSSVKAYTAGTKSGVTDAKKLSVKKTSYSLKVGKAATIKPKTVKRDNNKKILRQIPEFRYQSSNTSVATVSKRGKIKAKKEGVCTIYVYAVNGYAKKIKVSVKR